MCVCVCVCVCVATEVKKAEEGFRGMLELL